MIDNPLDTLTTEQLDALILLANAAIKRIRLSDLMDYPTQQRLFSEAAKLTHGIRAARAVAMEEARRQSGQAKPLPLTLGGKVARGGVPSDRSGAALRGAGRIVRLTMIYRDENLTLYCGEAMGAMADMAEGSVHAVVTDPAYASLNKWRGIGTTTRLGGHRDEGKRTGWFETVTNEELYYHLCEFARLLPKNGHAWVMGDGETMPVVCGYVREGDTGFDYAKPMPVIKLRQDGDGLKPGLGYHLRATHEYVVLCEKGRRRLNGESDCDVFPVPWRGDAETRPHTPDGKPYPTAKPFMLMRSLIEQSTSEGETVFDPFSGGGATAFAALTTKRKVICCDKSEYACAALLNRCSGFLTGPLPDLPGVRRDALPLLSL